MVLLSMVAAHAPRLVVDQAGLILDVLHSAGGSLQVWGSFCGSSYSGWVHLPGVGSWHGGC